MTTNLGAERIERDFLGAIAVPAEALFGPQTARAMANFRISGIRRFRGDTRASRRRVLRGGRLCTGRVPSRDCNRAREH